MNLNPRQISPNRPRNCPRNRPRNRPGFTLIEMVVAGIIAALLLGVVSGSIAQLGKAKNSTQRRHTAFLRADTALGQIRRDIASISRSADLFYTRFVIYAGTNQSPRGDLSRDEILLFNTRLRTVRDQDYVGEGLEYESHYRITEDDFGPVLWHRRDALPDEFPFGGGVATPLVDGVVELFVEAYDGIDWFNEWDSDYDGLPVAVRVTVTAGGHRAHEDPYEESIPFATLQTVIAIDRIPLPQVAPPPPLVPDPNNPAGGNADGATPGAPTDGGNIPSNPGIPGSPGTPINPGGNRPTPTQTPNQPAGGFGTTLDGGL